MNSQNYLEPGPQPQENKAQRNAAQRCATEIRGLMGARRLNATDLANVIGVSTSTAKRRLNGDADLSVNELEEIAAWLEVPVGRIIAPTADATYSK